MVPEAKQHKIVPWDRVDVESCGGWEVVEVIPATEIVVSRVDVEAKGDGAYAGQTMMIDQADVVSRPVVLLERRESAKEAAERYDKMFDQYREACRKNDITNQLLEETNTAKEYAEGMYESEVRRRNRVVERLNLAEATVRNVEEALGRVREAIGSRAWDEIFKEDDDG